MICPRCDSQTVDLLTKAPLDNAWEVYFCETCCFSWRSTESEDITNPAKYNRKFKVSPDKIPTLGVIPPIPDLKK